MVAQVPNRKDEKANHIAFDKVRADKDREAKNGQDGTWVRIQISCRWRAKSSMR